MINHLKKGKFPEIWKVTNVVPVHKKEDKSLVKNYFPINLLPIFGKVFKRVIYNSLFNYFLHKKVFTSSQSGFLPGDSCIAQLLSIIHEIQSAFDDNPTVNVKGIILDISKAFNKVSSLNFMSSVGFQVSKIWMFVWKNVCRSSFCNFFSSRNNSLEAPVFWFSKSVPCVVEESGELWILISWVLG